MESPFAQNSELVKHYNQRYAALRSRISNLSRQLKGFSVVNTQKQLLGKIADVTLEAGHRPSLIVVKGDGAEQQTLTLDTGSIQKVDVRLRIIQVEDGLSPTNGWLAGDPGVSEPNSEEQATIQHPLDKFLDIDADSHDEAISTAEPVNTEWSAPTHAPEILSSQPAIPDQHLESTEPTLPDNASERVAESEVLESINIPLLEERLKVDYTRHKIGEIVLHKKIETRMVTIPVRYERLIVEQISPERKQLADIRLSDGETPVSSTVDTVSDDAVVSGEFATPGIASQVLNAIAGHFPNQCRKVRIDIELEDASLKDIFQRWMDRGDRG